MNYEQDFQRSYTYMFMFICDKIDKEIEAKGSINNIFSLPLFLKNNIDKWRELPHKNDYYNVNIAVFFA